MKPMMKTLLAVVPVLILAACAGSQEELTLAQKLEQKHYRLGEPVERIRDYRVSGWNSVDDEHLIIHAGPSESYLLTLRTPCHNLRSAEHIAFSTTVGSLTRLDKVIVRSRPDGFTEHCWIEAMHALQRLPPA
jgi:hypothetical protein